MSSKSKHYSNTKSNAKFSAQESGLDPVMMTNITNTLNCLSDAMIMSVSATTQGAIQSVMQKIQQGHDELMKNEHMYLTKIVSDNANKASAYIVQDNSKICHHWIKMELEPYHKLINQLDAEDDDKSELVVILYYLHIVCFSNTLKQSCYMYTTVQQ
jgi:Cys-tRNA synthase (O-phospho-L-seryl-tRNA:Cys-tRNA synthase)